MRGKFPQILLCLIMGHEQCVCNFCIENELSFCERCDGDID